MIEITLDTEIGNSADECWEVFGGDNADIYKWKSGIR